MFPNNRYKVKLECMKCRYFTVRIDICHMKTSLANFVVVKIKLEESKQNTDIFSLKSFKKQ
jgi:hypothetical protein